jgi:Tfp pilus assembly protein PilO
MSGQLQRLGIPGVMGAGLLLFCLSLYLGTISPDQEALETLHQEETKLSAFLQAPEEGKTKPSATAGALPPVTAAAELPEKLNTLADKSQLAMERVSYRLTHESGLYRYEVSIQLKASYPTLRCFLKEALALSPVSTLDELSLRRANAMAPTVEAGIRLTYYFVES